MPGIGFVTGEPLYQKWIFMKNPWFYIYIIVFLLFLVNVGLSKTMTVGTPTASITKNIPKFKSYKEWKKERVDLAEIQVKALKALVEERKKADPNLPKTKGSEATANELIKLENELQLAQTNLDLTKEMGLPDFFAGYLIKTPNKQEAIREIAPRLSPEEVAELMKAYADFVFGTEPADIPPSASGNSRESK